MRSHSGFRNSGDHLSGYEVNWPCLFSLRYKHGNIVIFVVSSKNNKERKQIKLHVQLKYFMSNYNPPLDCTHIVNNKPLSIKYR